MTNICFAGTYPPTKCGIADYTDYLIKESPDDKWGMLAFDRDIPSSLVSSNKPYDSRIWYGIPSSGDVSAESIRKGLDAIGLNQKDTVMWFQHENGLWQNEEKFAAMLKGLDMLKVITFHTLQFQSPETKSGLCCAQHRLLEAVFPHVDAITVFNHDVYWAVTSAFPEHDRKVSILHHGTHSYPGINRLSRSEAKEKLNDYLLFESDLPDRTKQALHKKRILTDWDTIVLGQTGFLCPQKQSEVLFTVRNELEKLIPYRRIAAVRIGAARDGSQRIYAEQLRQRENGKPGILLETWLPSELLPLAQRAFDVNFCWPGDCTQSGVMAHALGAGAIIAGRDLEGVGRTLKDAGQFAENDISHLIRRIRDIMYRPEIAQKAEESALRYARRYSWRKQAWKHYQLAEVIAHPASVWPQYSPLVANPIGGEAEVRSFVT